MNISALQAFLSSAKSNVDTAVTNNLGDTYVVLGNEAADLDSVVSAIVTAFYKAHSLAKEEKENKVDEQQSFVFPVVNCLREDLVLRTELIFFLKSNGIRVELLICRDEIDLMALQAGGKLKLTLVDHNVLAMRDAHLQGSIDHVIDHHKRDKPLDRRDIIEPVGSCCTLVAEMVLGLFDKDSLVCRLLYGTILLDTVNMSPSAHCVTMNDIKVVSELEDCLTKISGSRPNRDEVYGPLVKARSDISQLSSELLLRKDCKLLKTPEISIAILAVPLLSQKFLELPDAVEALKGSLRLNRCTAILVMGYEVNEANEIRRDVTIFADSIHKAKQVCTPMESCENLQLQFIKHATEPQAFIWVYEQKNIGLSRKFILPFLATHFEVKAQNQLEVDALAGVDILIPNGEMSPNKLGNGGNAVPAIYYTGVQSLGNGDPISHCGSNQSSAYNSCPYTPQNSCAEPEDGYALEHYFLPSFNSREMVEKIELKRHKLLGYDKTDDELKLSGCSSYPFTPKNSYVDSSLDSVFEHREREKHVERQNTGGILHAIDSEVLLKKLMEKRRGDMNSTSSTNSSNSNCSSKSEGMTKLNDEFSPGGDMMNSQLSPSSYVTFCPRATEIPPPCGTQDSDK